VRFWTVPDRFCSPMKHHLLLGIARTLVARPPGDGMPPYLATTERRGMVIGAAMQTPPSNTMLS